ncbi:copper resistance protein NlpE [Lysobacter auxotrophicus]|uniref:Copper resistance protein NlpE n=1 Tax=Lysobacter auxotrophicus TaxID=2992573 RepID=A0ABN6UIP3_9GAMM|nr:copper resistance protein NlpE [Lysobacter auxotrophicus]BDU16135.1 copper resistance protein NlpE [Lysobacter auxotrophicus]
MSKSAVNARTVLLAALAVAALSACKPQAPTEPAATPAPPEAAAPPAAPAADARPSAQGAPFDAKAFAGTFTGTLPCADCPGIDTRIELAADGTYTVTESYRERPAQELKGDGTWTVEENNQRLRLDPNSKSDHDRLFAILSNDEIRQLDMEGKPIESSLPYNLKRSAQ